jgi:hypothetical protein
MTFATTRKTLREDLEIIRRHGIHDFNLFCELIGKQKRKLVSCIPSISTHGEMDWLAKFVDWEKEFNESMNKE